MMPNLQLVTYIYTLFLTVQ